MPAGTPLWGMEFWLSPEDLSGKWQKWCSSGKMNPSETFPSLTSKTSHSARAQPSCPNRKKVNLSDFFLLAQIWIYPFSPSLIPLFLITLAYSPDLTLASQGTGFLHIHMSLGNWSYVDELCSRLLCSQNILLTDTRITNEWSSFTSAEYAMHLKCLSSMIGSSRHRDGSCVGCDCASARDTVEIQQKHWGLNGLAWTAPEDIAEEQEWQLLITPNVEDHQDHTTFSFSKHSDWEWCRRQTEAINR